MPRLRTGYSFRAAAGAIDECISRIQECGWLAAPMTDRASTFGFVKWEKAAKKNRGNVYGGALPLNASHFAFVHVPGTNTKMSCAKQSCSTRKCG